MIYSVRLTAYNEIKMAKTGVEWWPMAMIAASALIVVLCLVVAFVFLVKYRSERRKWMDALHCELNRVAPDRQTQWKTVSKLIDQTIPSSADTDSRSKAANKLSEFQYLSFESKNMQKDVKKKGISKATQIESSVEMQKQKVIPIGKLIDESTDSRDLCSADTTFKTDDNQCIRTTFVTTKEIETKSNDNCIPRIISVQMSGQTESIIRAIRSELNKLGHNSNAIPLPDDTQPEESIISNSSEA